MKVSADDVCNSISVSTDDISISGNRFIVNSDNFSLDRYGNLTANNANLSGNISATSGTIGGLKITPYGLVGTTEIGKNTQIYYNSVESDNGYWLEDDLTNNTVLSISVFIKEVLDEDVFYRYEW